MDLFGPMTIRDDCVKKGPRVYKKVYGVIYACTRTRGIYLDIATDYSTESVLHTVRRLMAQKGGVMEIISDPGSQLRGADRETSSAGSATLKIQVEWAKSNPSCKLGGRTGWKD